MDFRDAANDCCILIYELRVYSELDVLLEASFNRMNINLNKKF